MKLDFPNEIPRYKLYRRSLSRKHCCSACESLVGEAITDSTVRSFYFKNSVEKLIAGNEKLIHFMYQRLSLDNELNYFDELFERYFCSSHEKTNVYLRQVFERLILRIVYTISVKRIEHVTHEQFQLKNGTAVNYHVGLPCVSATVTQQETVNDIPRKTNIVVDCDDKHFSLLTKAISTYFSFKKDGIVDFRQQILLRYLVGNVKYTMNRVKNDSLFIYKGRCIADAYLNNVYRILCDDFEEISSQRVQLHEIVGPSGIGKSCGVLALKHFIYAHVPLISYQDIVYTRANDYWWNGYRGQPIILYDDFTHGSKRKMKFDLAMELISVASGTLQNPPMAFVKDMLFTSVVGYITSNIPLITTVADSATVSALKRRVISNQWHSMDGFMHGGEYQYSGLILNTIQSKVGGTVFSTLSDVCKIINERVQLECDLSEDLVYDESPIHDAEESHTTIGKCVDKTCSEESASSVSGSNQTLIDGMPDLHSICPKHKRKYIYCLHCYRIVRDAYLDSL